MKQGIMAFYLFVLSGTALCIFIIGVFVAPVIFGHESILHMALFNRFEAGLLMTKIFQRFNIILALCALFIMSVEGMSLIKKARTKSMATFGVLSLVEIFLFLFYFTPRIVDAQSVGESAVGSNDFQTIHYLAELDFKAMLLTITTLAFLRFAKSLKEDPCECDSEQVKK